MELQRNLSSLRFLCKPLRNSYPGILLTFPGQNKQVTPSRSKETLWKTERIFTVVKYVESDGTEDKTVFGLSTTKNWGHGYLFFFNRFLSSPLDFLTGKQQCSKTGIKCD